MKTLRQLLLVGSVLGVGVALNGVAAADDLPTLAQPEWLFTGGAEFGGQVFITKPGAPKQTQQETTDSNGNVILPSWGNSAAKFNEYGRQTDPLFMRSIDFSLKRKDGGLNIFVLGAHIGEDNQKLEIGVEQPGQQYLTLDWDKTDHLRSNTAQSIFGGVGSTNLTVDPNVVQALYGALFPFGSIATGAGVTQASLTNQAASTQTGNSTVVTNGLPVNLTANPVRYTFAGVPYGCFLASQAGTAACNGKTPVQTTILDNENVINLGIQRDRKEIGYRWTPDDHWDIKVDYSNEHRYGVQEQGFLFSSSTSTPMAQVPMPIDDTTQDASITAEYFGLSPWGMKWNGILKYDTSIYTDAFSSFDVENPFGGPGSPAGAGVANCPISSTTTGLNCYGEGQMGTAPNNGANTVMGQLGVDLPGFRNNRYMGTIEYSSMTQNQGFIPMTINPGYTTGAGGVPVLTPGLYSLKTNANQALSASPASSLNGVVDTFLFNNVLSTQLTSDLKNKLNYRYYSDENHTPILTFQNWIVNDAAIASSNANSVGSGNYAPHTTLFQSYTKQDAGEEMTWRPVSWASIGGFGGWEQYRYSEYAANETNEYTAKVFGSLQPFDWATVRFNNFVAVRKYDNYNWQSFVGNLGVASQGENPYLVDYNIANRNRSAGNLYVDLQTPISGLTLTPTAGYRWDEFPTDQNLISQATAQLVGVGGAQPGFTQLGLRRDQNLNLGLEADWAVNSRVSLNIGYTFERSHQMMYGTSSATSDLQIYNGTMDEYVHTLMAGANFQIIPDRLSLKLSATHEYGKDWWGTSPGPSCIAANAGSGTNCGVVSAGNPANPPEGTTFDHFDATLLYKLDPLAFGQTKTTEAIFQLHYLYERNSVSNWQSGGVAPYMYSTTNSSTTAYRDMIFMAGDNPNYNAQALMASLIFKW